jgi:uncharacterized repeat protein (TIGR01451 family)
MHVVADFNGDTHPDVITASESNVPVHLISLRLLTNDGTGTLTLVPGFSLPFEGTFTAVDIDRDGDQDLAIIIGADLILRRNDGQATFGAAETIIAGMAGWPAFGDFNGDNRTDVAVAIGTSGIAVALANASGGFLAPVVHAVPGGAHGVADPADLNGDGRLDLFTIAGDENAPAPGASVLLGDGAGGFGGAVQATSDFVYLPTLADVNGDGRPDLVGISSISSFGVWLGNGGGTFSAPVQFANAVFYAPAVGDLNGDGRPDLATGDINGTLNVFFNNCGAAPANLRVAVAESADPVNEGDELTYTVTLTNLTGTAATGVRLTGVLGQLIADDPVVPNVTVLGATSSVGGTLTTIGATHVWTVPTLAANSAATFTFRFRPLAGGALEFTAGVTSDGAETDPFDNGARETTIVNATGSTLAVTTTADSGPGSLRQAIEISNADSGDRDTIVFNIPGGGVPTITLQAGLDRIEQPVVIDGTTQPGAGRVELNGNGLAATGLVVQGGNSIVRGMIINRFGSDAISLESGGGNVVEGNFIGTDPTGTLARPNISGGIRVFSSNNRIGGLTPAARNVISGNQGTGITLNNSTAIGNLVQGNYIGINAAGTAALPNTAAQGGITLRAGASGNTIGGAVAGAGNVVSGHPMHAVTIINANTNDNIVQGNFIGTDPTGMIRIANGASGIGLDIVNAQRTIVGGPGLARNVISGNGTGIQMRTGASGTVVQNNYIGVNSAGSAAIANGLGILIQDSATGNTIGGLTAGLGNVISGNTGVGINVSGSANNTTIQGNVVGLDAGGTLDLGNTSDGIILNGVTGTLVGGTTPAARNVVSGNNNAGVRISGAAATGNLIRGNYIGVNAAGTGAVGNSNGGVTVQTGATGTTIGGAGAGAGNVISGNTQSGILVQTAANGNTIQGNLIGLNAAGTQALANAAHGVDLNGVSGTIVGGTAAGAGNVLSGNGAYGIRNLAGSTGTVVLGNRIGTNAAGSGPVANGLSGLLVDGNGTTIGGTGAGEANTIAYNAFIGVIVLGGTGHAIVGNSIFSNGELGIDVGPFGVTANDTGDGDTGANNLQNFPVLSAVTGGVQGTLNSTPNTSFRIHYFSNAACDASGNGEGQTYLGETTLATDADGNATLAGFSAAVGTIVTATATSAANNTSELSACVTVPAAPPQADLMITQSDSADPVTVGQAFNYVLVASNSGPASATSVVVTNTLPTGVTASSAVSTLGSCTIGDRTITCAIGTLALGGSATVTIGVSGVAPGLVTNSASISGAQLDPVPGNNTDTEDTTLTLASCAGPSYSGPVRIAMPAFDSLFVEQADLNGDGRNDLVVSMLVGGLAVRLNQGGGNFAAAVPVSSIVLPRGFALADLNRDGRIDIAVATETGLQVVMGAGDGTFGPAAAYQSSASDPITVTAADLDMDGDIDLILDASDSGDDLPVFRNNGTGVFAAFVDVQTTAEEPLFPVVADLNRDGRPDIAVGSGVARFSVLLADGAGGYQPATGHGSTDKVYLIRGAADLDGDGNIDLVAQVFNDFGDSLHVLVLRGDGNGGFDAGTDVLAGPTAQSLRLADVNGDGRPDLVAHHPTLQTVAVQIGQAGGSFAAPVHFPAPYAIHPDSQLDDDGAEEDFYSRPSVGDLNGDGQLDIAVGDASGAIQVLFSTCGQPAGDLSVAVQESADPVAEGASFSYSVVVTNHGPATSSGATVHLSIDGPPGVRAAAPARFTAGTGASCVVADQHITCAVPALESTETLALQATVSTLAGATLTFGAGVTSANFDPTPGNNSAFETTTVTPGNRSIAVTNANDSGPGSLRNAIAESNADSGDRDTIVFNIPGAGVPTITLQSELWVIDQPVVIDGTTQPTTARVELNGNGLLGTGLIISGGNSVVRGLVINRFAGDAISLEANGGNVVEGNRIGTDSTGSLARPNGSVGIRVFSANNRIGGLTPAARNLISGNQGSGITLQNSTATANVVQGNYIGITAAGLAALPNANGGVSFFNGASANTIGGAASGAGNVISGNTGLGINVTFGSNGNTIQGNFIGLDAAGTFDLGNTSDGIFLNGVSGTIVGGSIPAARNVVSGNNNVGVRITGAAATGNLIRGNYIGVNASGGAPVGNTFGGITIQTSATTNVIGGTGAGDGNLISGNFLNGINLTTAASGNTILGNFVGVDAAGNADLGNTGDGINIAGVSGTILGGATSGARNVVSGNNNVGIRINGAAATGNRIRGNYVGVNAAGAAAVANTNGGIAVQNGASSNTIGGSGTGEGNVISGNNTNGISLQTGANNNAIQGNAIGVDPAGTIDLGNNGNGIHVNGVSGTIIGGTSAAARNIVSGNNAGGIRLSQTATTNTTVEGNYVGVDAAGSLAIANGGPGIVAETGAHDNTIGGTAPGAGNLVSGNALSGITLMGAGVSNNVVHGNRIGTDALVTTAIPNLSYGVNIADAADNVVGGSGNGARNIISGNRLSGVFIGGTGNAATGNIVLNNFIGTNGTGMSGIGNAEHGILIQSARNNSIGAAGAGNVISGNVQNGIAFFDSTTTGNTVSGNRIGTNFGATQSVANGADGIRIDSASTNTIGGPSTGAGNIVAGNGQHGIGIYGAATGNQIIGNVVGLREPPNVLGNGLDGIQINNGSNNAIGGLLPGEANTISWNGRAGVTVLAGTGNRILNDLIFANTGLGIDLLNDGLTANESGDGDTGPNNLQNFPVLTAVASGVQGTLNSTPGSTFSIQFFGNAACDATGNGEGQTLLGTTSVTTNAGGTAAIPLFAAAAGQIVTATATSSSNDTSEFSACVTVSAGPGTFTVSNTNNAGTGSLRQAILDANASTGTFDTIAFNIPGSGPFRIAPVPTAPLPTITDRVTIDATTQPGYAGTPLIELDGTDAGGNGNGLWISADGCVIRGLAINRFGAGGVANGTGGAGIVLQSANGIIEANFIGTDPTGTLPRPNRTEGVWIASSGNRIGGTTAAARNVISGNGRIGVLLGGSGTGSTTIQGNYIGLDVTGTANLGNGGDGIVVNSASNVIGGDVAGAGNVISSNIGRGIWLDGELASGNVVAGNLIGTNRQGSQGLGNSVDGVHVSRGSNNRIGGELAASRNIISGNGRMGVLIDGAGASLNTVAGNYIGTDGTGLSRIGNGFDGVSIRVAGNTVGGSSGAAGNVIGGNNGNGVAIEDTIATGNRVLGNWIGLGANGASAVGNGLDGVYISAPGNLVGGTSSAEANSIANNSRAGVMVSSGIGNRILGNSVFDNFGLGIDLGAVGITPNDTGDADTGGNSLQNFPILAAAAGGVEGTLSSRPNGTYRIEYFGSQSCDPSGNGEGVFLLGVQTVTTDGTGEAVLPFLSAGSTLAVTATATSTTTNDTSEFSECVRPTAPFRTWISNTGGNWEDPTKWSGGVVPQPGEIAVIAVNGTVIVSTATVALDQIFTTAHIAMSGGALSVTSSAGFAGGLTMTGGVLDGPGQILLQGASTWTGGTFRGAGELQNLGTLTVTMPSIDLLLERRIVNQGMLQWNTAGITLNGRNLHNFFGGILEFQSNLTIREVGAGGGRLINQGILRKSGPIGALTFAGDQGVVFSTFGVIQLRLGPANDVIVSNRMVELGGGLELLLEPGFDPAQGASFKVMEWLDRSSQFLEIFGVARRYLPTYTSTELIVSSERSVALPIPFDGFSGGERIETFTQNFDRQGTPVTFNGITYNSPGPYLESNNNWDGLFPNFPTASAGPGLSDVVGRSQLQLDFSTPVKRVGLLASTGTQTTFIMRAYDNDLNEIGATSATMPGFAQAVFLGLQAPVNIRRILVTEAFDNGQLTVIDDIRYENGSNQPPVANAGPDQSVNADSTVQLNGDRSSDPEGQPLTYLWSFGSRPAVSNATLNGATTATPTFIPDVPGPFTIRLIVNDGALDSDPDAVTVNVNAPPVANAGPDQTVPVGSTVQLDGAGSSDPESSGLSYHWILNTRPPGSAAVLSNADIRNPNFFADAPGTYIAQLVVNDGLVNSSSDLVVIHTANRAPIANAGADITNVALNTEVSLNGTASADPDGDPLTYSWAFVQRPSGSAATLVGTGTATPSFTIDRAGRYTVRLTANDGQLPGTDDVDVITVNVPPVANAGPDQTVHEGDLVTLNGNQSSDENGNDLSYRWSFISRPQDSAAQLNNANVVAPTFTADRPGVYTLQLLVNDTIVDGAPDTVTVTALSNHITLALVDTTLVGVGTHPGLRVVLPFPAPTGGVVVSLTSSDQRVATVSPATVTIAAGGNEGRVTVNGLAAGTADLTATAPAYADGVLNIAVTNDVLSVPAAVNVALGGTTSMPVSIPSAAPSGGLAVSLVSSNSAAVEVLTPSITIPAGALAANATISGKAPGTATVVASAASFSSASAQATTLGNLNITVSSIQVRPGFPGTITIQLQSAGSPVAAPSPGVPITFTATALGCAAIAAATIPTGLTSTTSTVTFGGSATLPCTTNVVASSPGLTGDNVSVTVNPDPGITLFSLPALVGAGLMEGQYTARLGEANHGGVTVRIASSDPGVLLVSRNATTAGTAFVDVPLANGFNDAGYYIHGVEGARGAVTLTAAAPGFTQAQGTVTVGETALQLGGLPGTTTSLSVDTPFYVYIGVLNSAGNIAAFQQLRAGAPNLTITVSHTNTSVAQLTTTAGSGQTRTVTVAAGQTNSPTSVATGGVAFDPLSAGSTTVNATAPGFRAATGIAVPVTSPAITLFSLPALVGAGLMDGAYTARLGASAHGGATVRITSSDPGALLVSRNSTTAGTAFVDIPVANGSTDATYYIHGVEGARSPVTLTATATGFTQAQGTATVGESALQLGGLPGTTTSLSVDTPFYVYIGVLNSAGNIAAFQQLRAGAPAVTVTVSHTNTAVAQLLTTAGAGQTRTVTIAAGQTNSPTSVATGGVSFDPISAGSTTVNATATGFRAAVGVSVPVTSPAITLFSLPAVVGAGLMEGAYTARLGATAHGGVTVRITSSDPGVLVVSRNSTSAGTAFVDIPVANGSTDATYYIHGVEGARGSVTLTATAPGFTQAQGTAAVAESGLQLGGVPGQTTTLSIDTPFYVSIGVLNAAGNIAAYQQLRAGAPSVTITVSHTTPTVAQLVTTAGAGQTRTVTINAGQTNSPTAVATGGVSFDPIGGGSTTVNATATGFRAAAGAAVTVDAPGITLFSLPVTVGAGLMEGAYTARLGATSHGGVTLRITSSNPDVVVVSRNSTIAGTAFVDVPVVNGQTDATYYIHGVEGGRGTVTLTAIAPGFTQTQGTATVAESGLQLGGVPGTTTTLTPDSPFYVSLGVLNSAGNIAAFQQLRAGAPNLTITVSHTNTAVAQLTTTAGSGQTRTVTIAAGQTNSPTSVPNGGVAFDPIGAGSTTVNATATGFRAAAADAVTVTAPGITLFSMPASLGAGLQHGVVTARLGATGHGGVTMRVTSSDPSVVLLSRTTTGTGAAFIDIPIANGGTDGQFYVQGVRNARGQATVSATAPGFTQQQSAVDVVVPALDIQALPSSVGATDASTLFYVRVGVANTFGTALSLLQEVAPGPSLVVTLSNSAASVAQLVTTAGGAQTRTVLIAPGSSNSPLTLAAGGVQFDPLSGGETTVTASNPGAMTTDAAEITVTVTGEELPEPEAAQSAQAAPSPGGVSARVGFEAAPRVFDQRVSGRALADLQELLELRPRVQFLHFPGAPEPVGERRVVAERREVVEEQRGRLATALPALLEF